MCGGWNKWRGATMGPRGRGRAQGGGRTLYPCGQVLAPLGVLSVPDILKYSRKKIIFKFQGIWRTFIFGVFLIARIIQEIDRKLLFLLYFY